MLHLDDNIVLKVEFGILIFKEFLIICIGVPIIKCSQGLLQNQYFIVYDSTKRYILLKCHSERNWIYDIVVRRT